MNYIKVFAFCLCIVLALFTFSSCSDTEGCTDTTAINFNADADIDDGSCIYAIEESAKLKFSAKVGTANYVEGNTYTIGGVDFQITVFRFYLSGLTLTTQGGSTVTNSDYFYWEPGNETFVVSNLQDDTYTNLSFDVGVDSTTNHLDPTTYDGTHPLAIKTPSNHWGWANGYRFIRVDGDLDIDGDGTFETPMQYHIGGDALLRNVSKVADFTTSGSSVAEINISVDIAEMFNGIDLAVDPVTHVADNLPAAQAFTNNLSNSFTLN